MKLFSNLRLQYDCNFAPLELNNVIYSWWNDRDGNEQYFWAGNNTEGIHTCQCGINGNCLDPAVKCNCDSAAPVPLVDDGIVIVSNIHFNFKLLIFCFWCRCHNGQKCFARHSIEFRPNSTGNFVRRPHTGPSHMQRIKGYNWIAHVL